MTLEFYYITIYLILIALIFFGLKKATNKAKNNILQSFIGLNIIWLIYLFLLSNNGFLFNRTLPPRFPLLVFIPILIIIVYSLKFFLKNNIHKSIPKSWPVYYQTFRLVMEQIILVTAFDKIIPIEATYHGYNFEFYFALTAPIIAYLAFQKKLLSESIVVIWNVVGIIFLIIVVSIVASAFYSHELWGYQHEIVKDEFAKLPLILLPAFMVPSAILMHLFSILQIIKDKDKDNSTTT